jgi:tetratricopeptide (TPR) repeat protein
MKLKYFALSVLLACSSPSFAQENDTLVIKLLDNDRIGAVNLDQDKFIASLGLVTEYCKGLSDLFAPEQKIGILLTVHTSGAATYKCYSSPALPAAAEAKILKDLQAIPLEHTRLVDFPVFIAVHSRPETATDFTGFEHPVQQKKSVYVNADLATKLQLNKEYALKEVLPVLTAYELIAENQYAGVKNFGKKASTISFGQTQDVYAFTSKNPDYWRATMEMGAGNQLIPTTKIAALVAQGELDQAMKYIEIVRMFSDKESISAIYLDELKDRLSNFHNELGIAIEKGISAHDRGNYTKAIAIYNDILKIYPNSAWALYEKYYSEHAMKVALRQVEATDGADWAKAKKDIYKHNPLYHMDVHASNGRDAYLILRRQEISKLFQNEDQQLQDVYQYAMIASDLGVYDFAAQLFWLSIPYSEKDIQKDALHQYLYCLEQLGVKDLKANFEGDFSTIFKEIEQQKKKAMKESPIYQSMKK